MPHNMADELPDGLAGITNAIQVMGVSKADGHLDNGQITCWLVDTRKLWPGTKITTANGAADALALITPEEQKGITSKMFIQDARMSLASALIKRLYISRTLDIPWKRIYLGRRGDPKHGKPCAVDSAGRAIDGIDFNVSHQAGLVALIGWNGNTPHLYNSRGGVDSDLNAKTYQPDIQVGVDIVCVNERDDWRMIDSEGFGSWIDMYDYVFSDETRWSMKYNVDRVTMHDGTVLSDQDIGRHDRCLQRNKPIALATPGGKTYRFNSNLILESKLRRFYTYFCYMEAYVKLAGEALLAPWLQDLEFLNVRSPKPALNATSYMGPEWGEEVEDVQVHMKGKEVDNVNLKIQSFGESFMIATAIQGKIHNVKIPAFQRLDLRSDIMDFAEDYLTISPSSSLASSP